MACGCNKNRTSASRGPAIRPGVYNRASVGSLSAPVQVRSQSTAEIHQVKAQQVKAQSLTSPKEEAKGSNAAKRKIQALRREAIFKALGK